MPENEIVRKTIQFKVDQDIKEPGVFRGIGSGFGDIDQGDDIVNPDAFNESLANKTPDQVKCLWQHNQTQPMGYYRELIPTSDGLQVEGKIFETSLGKDALILMIGDEKGKGVDGLSIGFRIIEFEFKEIDGRRIRIIKKADLIEISVVTFPMHLRCRIGDVKSMTIEEINEIKSLADMEGVLKENGFSNNQATAFIVQVKKLSNEGEPQKEKSSDDEGEPQKPKLKDEDEGLDSDGKPKSPKPSKKEDEALEEEARKQELEEIEAIEALKSANKTLNEIKG